MKESVQPKFTVYVVSHNYGKYVGDAIESVLRQSVGDWELLLINDNSTDNTAEVMTRYASDDRVRIFNTTGIGLHAVCNLALREARGEYIIRLDGDDLFDENILLVLGNVLNQSADVALVFPDFYLVDEFGKIFGQERLRKIYQRSHVNDTPPNGACTLFRTNVLREVGGYRDDMRAQDGYYAWSKIVTKHKCVNVNLPLFYYRRHGQNLTNTSHKIFEARRQIKRESLITSLEAFSPIIAVIPCRKNYDFIPNLWNQRYASTLRTLGAGKTLLENAIETCIATEILDHIVVACDDEEALETMKKYNDPRLSFFLRNREDTIRSRSIAPMLEQITKKLDPKQTGVTVLSYVQSPFITSQTLEESIFTLIINNVDCCFGVQELDRTVYRRAPHGLEQINLTSEVSGETDRLYMESRTVLASRNRNFANGTVAGPSSVHLLVSEAETYFIDSQESLEVAWLIAARRGHGFPNEGEIKGPLKPASRLIQKTLAGARGED